MCAPETALAAARRQDTILPGVTVNPNTSYESAVDFALVEHLRWKISKTANALAIATAEAEALVGGAGSIDDLRSPGNPGTAFQKPSSS